MRHAWPSDDALPGFVALHGSLAAASRALGRADSELSVRLARQKRAALRRPPVDPEMHEYAGILRRDPCGYCADPCEHIDHIEPVSRGGGLGWDNLTAACGPCNRRKQRRSLLVFLLEGGDANDQFDAAIDAA